MKSELARVRQAIKHTSSSIQGVKAWISNAERDIARNTRMLNKLTKELVSLVEWRRAIISRSRRKVS